MNLLPSVSATMAILFPLIAFANSPDCTSPEAWPSRMAFVKLRNAQILRGDTQDYDAPKVARLASERIGKDRYGSGVYKQVHRVTFINKVKRATEIVEAIVVNTVSDDECSISDVDVYLVSKHLNADAEK